MIKYTNGQICPGVLPIPEGKEWTHKFFKNAMLRKLAGLKRGKFFSVNKKDPYYQDARAEWGGIIWGDEVPVKENDDIHDTLLGGIWVLHPPSTRDLDFRETEGRELPIEILLEQRRKRREDSIIAEALTRL